MKNIFVTAFILLAFSFAFGQTYQLQTAFPNLTFSSALDFQHADDGTDRIFVVERAGRIKVFPNQSNISTTATYLDITDRVSSGGEMGLLGLAFHPNYESNGYLYVNYTVSSPSRATRISRFSVNPNNINDALEESEVILLTFSQPYSNHNGGQVSFGPDGFLYIAVGDGGSGGDPQNYAQNKSSLLGKILRIDVDNPQGGNQYGIPSSNPFAGNTQGYKQEIFATGMRNPWRFSFDFENGWLWCADVGQNAYEEIDIIVNGGNYGWRCYEGFHPYNTNGCGPQTDYINPIWEYPRSEGYSVTGGFVYRGPNLPGLYGKYIYGDYGTKKIWSLSYDGVNPAQNTFLLTSPGSITSFGVDQNNELYVISFDGKIYRFTPTAAVIAPSGLRAEFSCAAICGNQLNWNDNSNNELGFVIERKTSGSSFTPIDTVSAGQTSFLDSLISNNTNYTYRVYAYNSGNNSGFSNQAAVMSGVVPVEFISFTASFNDDKVILKWDTGSEKNNKGFEVERFINDNWKIIGTVSGKGTRSVKSSYEFVDDYSGYNFSGNVKYRLKQIDYDGTFAYSSEASVNIEILNNNYQLLQNYPNPFNPSTTISYFLPEESKVKIEVVNSLGEVVDKLADEIKPQGKFEINWNASKLSSGIYFIKMKAESSISGNNFSNMIKAVYLK